MQALFFYVIYALSAYLRCSKQIQVYFLHRICAMPSADSESCDEIYQQLSADVDSSYILQVYALKRGVYLHSDPHLPEIFVKDISVPF